MTPKERFDYAVGVVLEHEGGLSNDKYDKGGITKYGISLRFIQAEGIDINDDGLIDPRDIKNLSLDDAKDIYKAQWWDKYHYDDINDLKVATKLFDMSVNTGAHQAHKLAQRAVNILIPEKLVVDGILGKKTLNALNGADKYKLMNAMRSELGNFYKLLVQKTPSLGVFMKGWLARAAW